MGGPGLDGGSVRPWAHPGDEADSVTVSNENGLNFENGVITIRADERVALQAPRLESFVVGTWA
ncbi:hypothetical protein [Streptomyces sp. CBMA123]|uniref:hypothetical protein n=1 Tax=Streptomyces sp. CBMA123 TaxID=1896313 RepID=UPI001661B323|nr:hypothetical protein [Streptomyces sp. CBMA123]MBD0688839.1 hypothetical protein [Streptomyces sp. CBMA123]